MTQQPEADGFVTIHASPSAAHPRITALEALIAEMTNGDLRRDTAEAAFGAGTLAIWGQLVMGMRGGIRASILAADTIAPNWRWKLVRAGAVVTGPHDSNRYTITQNSDDHARALLIAALKARAIEEREAIQ